MTSSPPPPPPPVVSLDAAAEAARALGNAAFHRGAWSVAVDHYAAATLGNPEDARPRANAAAALLKIGKIREAREQAARACELEPLWPKAHWRFAEACEAGGDLRGAAGAFERAVELMEAARAKEEEKENGTTKTTTTTKKETPPSPFPKERRVAAAARLRAERERRVEEAAAALDSRPRGREQMLSDRAVSILGMRHQFEQSMLSPEWELEDYGWRPSFSAEEERFFAAKVKDERALSLVVARRPSLPSPPPPPSYCNRFLPVIVALAGAAGDLASPKRAVAAMGDAARMRAWSRAFGAEAAEAAAAEGAAFSVVAVGGAGGALGLLAAKASASASSLLSSSVIVVEETPLAREMAREALLAASSRGFLPADVTSSSPPLSSISVAPCQLRGVSVAEKKKGTKTEGGGETIEEIFVPAPPSPPPPPAPPLALLLPSAPSLLALDLLDHTVLGLGLLDAVDDAARRRLIELKGGEAKEERRKETRLLPRGVVVRAAVVDARTLVSKKSSLSSSSPSPSLPSRLLSSLDLSAMDREFRWTLQPERAEEVEEVDGSKEVTGWFVAAHFDLEARARRAAAASFSGGDNDTNDDEEDKTLPLRVTSSGVATAVLFWAEVDLGPAGGVISARVREEEEEGEEEGEGEEGENETGGGGSVSSSSSSSPPSSSPRKKKQQHYAPSLGVAIHFLDHTPVLKGAKLLVRVRRDAGQLLFQVVGVEEEEEEEEKEEKKGATTTDLSSPPPPLPLPLLPALPRSSRAPAWHFPMLRDTGRAEAFALGIAGAVRRKKRSLGTEKEIHLLDAGAGCGLLSLLSAKLPLPFGTKLVVTAVEQSQALASCAAAVMEANGVSPRRVKVVQGDVRRLQVVEVGGRVASSSTPTSPAAATGAPLPPSSSSPFAPRLPRPADLAVFEVFDAGLIGEGALHVAAALVRNRLVVAKEKKDRGGVEEEEGDSGDGKSAAASETTSAAPLLVPCRAKVFCQLITISMMPTAEAEGSRDSSNPLAGLFAPSSGFSSSDGNGDSGDNGGEKLSSSPSSSSWPLPWARGAHADYEAIDLSSPASSDASHRGGWSWQPLTEPALAFEFDFGSDATPSPESREVRLRPLSFSGAAAAGEKKEDSRKEAHAVAFWFELDLGGGVSLSTSPHFEREEEEEERKKEKEEEEEERKGRRRQQRFFAPSFRQAVQWLPRGAVSVRCCSCCSSPAAAAVAAPSASAASSSSPAAAKERDEFCLEEEEAVTLLASHDTYGIKFSVPGRESEDQSNLIVPRAVAAALEAAAAAARALAAAAAHSPVAAREAAEAAKAVGARPRSEEWGAILLDAAAAAGVCGRLFM